MKSKSKKVLNLKNLNLRDLSIFFLGVGTTMLLSNLIIMISITNMQINPNPISSYYSSIVSAIILITFSIYMMNSKN